MEKRTVTTLEVAKLLGISRVAVFKKIRSGQIPAERAGRNYFINRKDLPGILGTIVTRERKRAVEEAVRKTVREYGETLRLLGKE